MAITFAVNWGRAKIAQIFSNIHIWRRAQRASTVVDFVEHCQVTGKYIPEFLFQHLSSKTYMTTATGSPGQPPFKFSSGLSVSPVFGSKTVKMATFDAFI